MAEKEIRLKWGTISDVPKAYVNHLYVSHAGGQEFHVYFGHLEPPITYGLEEKELPNELEIKPVFEIIVTPEIMKIFLDVLNGNFENYTKAANK